MPAPYDLFDYPQYWHSRKYEDLAEKMALKKFLDLVGKKESLVDLGGGYGRLTPTYLPYVKKILITDPSQNHLKMARENLSALKSKVKIEYKETSFPDLTLADSSFEMALMIRVIHHLADSGATIKEISRILKDNGYLILEFANKIHFLAIIKAFLRLDWLFLFNLKPYEQRSRESIAKKRILFLNHHPKKIFQDLRKNGFEIVKYYSVSNFRSPIIKRILPLKILLFLENYCQNLLSFFYFGPSIFVLAKKTHRLDN
ncbi:MAG: putative methyltransferase YcgJ [Microgenomates group bacterium ADurb.Bin219]|nr:MAG: putative methyltransferase YcgJ [Microgenomates group bacterium ADurb.Bin219]HNP89581.1 class I SAM-dependent methyltransferase [Candidatus Woesebacteria bacterium]